jgi:hypothetical protein
MPPLFYANLAADSFSHILTTGEWFFGNSAAAGTGKPLEQVPGPAEKLRAPGSRNNRIFTLEYLLLERYVRQRHLLAAGRRKACSALPTRPGPGGARIACGKNIPIQIL